MTAYIIGTACTPFAKFPRKTFRDLTREAYLAVLADAKMSDGGRIQHGWFSNCGMGTFGQNNIRGQVCFTPLVQEGLFPERVPIINVEGGCASASMALHGAWKDVLSGQSELSLAIGVEKTFVEGDPVRQLALFEGGIDQLNKEEWMQYYADAATQSGKEFVPNAGGGTVMMDAYATQAAYHMKKYGTTQRQIAAAASKNHYHGSLNPLAQYRFEVSIEQALTDRVISYPITRSMAAPVGDGAAAALVCSEKFLKSLPFEVQERAIAIRASSMSGGKYRSLDEPGLTRVAAKDAYQKAQCAPTDIDVAEVHDATSFSDIYQSEMLGFCDEGQGGKFVEAGGATLGGKTPMNVSGGLVSKGHPVGATGLSMIYELCLQLRHEAGVRQVEGADLALAENGGGTVGFDEAVCAVTILQRPN
jgi:acetyl-CoA acetyltransferase